MQHTFAEINQRQQSLEYYGIIKSSTDSKQINAVDNLTSKRQNEHVGPLSSKYHPMQSFIETPTVYR